MAQVLSQSINVCSAYHISNAFTIECPNVLKFGMHMTTWRWSDNIQPNYQQIINFQLATLGDILLGEAPKIEFPEDPNPL